MLKQSVEDKSQVYNFSTDSPSANCHKLRTPGNLILADLQYDLQIDCEDSVQGGSSTLPGLRESCISSDHSFSLVSPSELSNCSSSIVQSGIPLDASMSQNNLSSADLDVSDHLGGVNGTGEVHAGGTSPTSSSGSNCSIDVCRDFLRNVCKRGRRCKYKHPSLAEYEQIATRWARNEPVFCHDYQNTGCHRVTCKFIHCSREEEEVFRATGHLPAGTLAAMMAVGTFLDSPLLGEAGPGIGGIPICKDFMKGSCRRGGKCKFRHVSQAELELAEWRQHSIAAPGGPPVNITFGPPGMHEHSNGPGLAQLGPPNFQNGPTAVELTGAQVIIPQQGQQQATLTAQMQPLHQQDFQSAHLQAAHPHNSGCIAVAAAPTTLLSTAAGPAFYTPGQGDQPATLIPLSSAQGATCVVVTAALPPSSLCSVSSCCSSGHTLALSSTSMTASLPDPLPSSVATGIDTSPAVVVAEQQQLFELTKRARYDLLQPQPSATHQQQVVWTGEALESAGVSVPGGLVPAGSAPQPLPDYHMLMEENSVLRRKIDELRKQSGDLQAANEILLEQNARLRNSKQRAAQLFQQISNGIAVATASHVVTPTVTPAVAAAVSVLAPNAQASANAALSAARQQLRISAYESVAQPNGSLVTSVPTLMPPVPPPPTHLPPPLPTSQPQSSLALAAHSGANLIAYPISSQTMKLNLS